LAGSETPNLNGSAYKTKFENQVKSHLEGGRKVEIRVEPQYNEGNSTRRPDAIRAAHRVDGGDWIKTKLDNPRTQ